MPKSDQYAGSLLHNAKPKPWDFCPSLTRRHTNDVDLSSVSSVHRTRTKGVELIGEEMEMEMAFRWKERGKENENEEVKETEREERKENRKLSNNSTGERSKKQKKVEREKAIDEIWKGVWN